MKIGWNTWGEPYWGYNYNEDCDYEHEICFYRLYICWEDKKAKQKKEWLKHSSAEDELIKRLLRETRTK